MSPALSRFLQVGAISLLALLVGLFVKGLIDAETTVAAQLKDGKRPQAPDFTLPALDGRGDVSLSQFRGRVVLLNFWASWCDSCKDEAPLFNQLSESYSGRGVVVVGVDVQDFLADARAFARTYHIVYPQVHSSDNGIYRRWGLTGLPETFLIGRDGVVRHHFPGQVSGAEVRAQLDPLLGEQPG